MSKNHRIVSIFVLLVVIATVVAVLWYFRGTLFPEVVVPVGSAELTTLYPNLKFEESSGDAMPVFFQGYQPLFFIDATVNGTQITDQSSTTPGKVWFATETDPAQATGSPLEAFIQTADSYLTEHGFQKQWKDDDYTIRSDDVQSAFGSVAGYFRIYEKTLQMIEVMAFAEKSLPTDATAAATVQSCPCTYGIFVGDEVPLNTILPNEILE